MRSADHGYPPADSHVAPKNNHAMVSVKKKKGRTFHNRSELANGYARRLSGLQICMIQTDPAL